MKNLKGLYWKFADDHISKKALSYVFSGTRMNIQRRTIRSCVLKIAIKTQETWTVEYVATVPAALVSPRTQFFGRDYLR